MLWNRVVLNSIDKRIPFHHNNLDLPPKPKFNFKKLKNWVQEFRRKFVLGRLQIRLISILRLFEKCNESTY